MFQLQSHIGETKKGEPAKKWCDSQVMEMGSRGRNERVRKKKRRRRWNQSKKQQQKSRTETKKIKRKSTRAIREKKGGGTTEKEWSGVGGGGWRGKEQRCTRKNKKEEESCGFFVFFCLRDCSAINNTAGIRIPVCQNLCRHIGRRCLPFHFAHTVSTAQCSVLKHTPQNRG